MEGKQTIINCIRREYNTTEPHKHKPAIMTQPSVITLSSLFLLLLALNTVVKAQDNNDIDYTCFPRRDYVADNKCQTIEDGICDNPNHGGNGGDDCLNQDCIDCNSECKEQTEYENEMKWNDDSNPMLSTEQDLLRPLTLSDLFSSSVHLLFFLCSIPLFRFEFQAGHSTPTATAA